MAENDLPMIGPNLSRSLQPIAEGMEHAVESVKTELKHEQQIDSDSISLLSCYVVPTSPVFGILMPGQLGRVAAFGTGGGFDGMRLMATKRLRFARLLLPIGTERDDVSDVLPDGDFGEQSRGDLPWQSL